MSEGAGLLAILLLIVFCWAILVTIYGAALVLVEHFWLGLFLLIFLSPIFFIWAFYRGIIGTND